MGRVSQSSFKDMGILRVTGLENSTSFDAVTWRTGERYSSESLNFSTGTPCTWSWVVGEKGEAIQ